MELAVGSQNGDHDVRNLKTEKSPKKNRITYNKEFLVECIKNPASTKKPSGFPLPNLECTLGTARSTKASSFTPVPTFGPKRKEEAVKKEKESTDSISLRPQSGSFASGCAANLNTAQLNHASSYGGKFLGMEEQSSRGFFDRELPKTSLASTRFASTKSVANDLIDRGRMERDRDRFEREKERERFNDRENQRERDYDSNERSGYRKMYNRGQPQWMSDGDQQSNSGNNRRKNHAHNGFERESHSHSRSDRHYDRDRNYRDRQEEAEPEWFSEGPTSRLDTIELRGLPEDTRNENKKPQQNNTSHTIDDEYAAMLSLSTNIDDRIETEPVGRSRFKEIFERNSEQKPVESKTAFQHEERANVPTPDLPTTTNEVQSQDTSPPKPQNVHEIEAALRSILFGGAKSESAPPTQDTSNSDFVKMIEGMSMRIQIMAPDAKPAAATGMNGGAVKGNEVDSRESVQGFKRMLFGRSEIPERDQGSSMGMPLHQERERVNPPPAVSAQNHGSVDDPAVVANHPNPGMIQQLMTSQGPVSYYAPPISSVNFAQMQAPQGSQAQMGPGAEHMHQQFPQMGGHRPPFGHPYGNPMQGEFVGHPQQFPPNRMPLSYPYPYQGHMGVVPPNPLQAFQEQIRQQHWGVLSPANVYSLLPPDFKKLVDAASVTPEFINRPEVIKVISALTSGSMSLNELGHQIIISGPQQTGVLPGVLHYALQGGFPIPVRGGYYPAQFPPPHQQPPPHQAQYQHQPMHMMPPPNQVRIGNFQQPSHPRPGVQVMPNLQFMPTSVLRKMTAEQHVRQILPNPMTSLHQGHVGIPSPPLQN